MDIITAPAHIFVIAQYARVTFLSRYCILGYISTLLKANKTRVNNF